MGSLVADIFLFCYEKDFMMSLSDNKQVDFIDAFNTTSRYLDDILNINKKHNGQRSLIWEPKYSYGSTIICDAQKQVTLILKQ